MRKLLLLSVAAMATVVCNAQLIYKDNTFQRYHLPENPVVLQQQNQGNSNNAQERRSGSSRALSNGVKLNSQRLGSSGNLLTVNNGNANQLDVNDTLNTVTFIHREDPTVITRQYGHVGKYRFDMSKDGGNTWIIDIGTICNDDSLNNVAVAARFPQALIYNPVGNTIPDSAYLIYSGTWHNTSDGWKGEVRGRGYLQNDSSSFNTHIDYINGGNVNIASGLCQGEPGVFWNVNPDYPGTSFLGGNLLTKGVIVEKGVWNPLTRDVDWTEHRIPQTFQTNITGTSTSATAFNIAFDPTGQYGWISCLGDITADNEKVLSPIFWRSTDYGNTWSTPTQISLKDITGIVRELNPTYNSGDPSSREPTAAFDADLVVDYKGNPHMEVIIGNSAGDYSIQQARYDVWDITFDANAPDCDTVWNGGWKGIHISQVETLRGALSNDNPAPQTQDNRPMASRSRDGKKLFFFWVDSDIDFILSDQNDLPNLFTRAFDLEHFTSTRVINITEGDSLWGGETLNTPGGLFGGATFGTIAPVASTRGDGFNVPLVLTQIDYNHDPLAGLGSYLEPAAFWYINNIDFSPSDFVTGLSAQIELQGSDTARILLNNSYTEEGASIFYLDTTCYPSGLLTLEIDSSEVDYTQTGTYVIRYYAKDVNGTIYAGATRVIVVGTPPVANFTFTQGNPYNRINFRDASQFSPNKWLWEFGYDGRTGTTPNPSHLFKPTTANYNVCLTATNEYGTSAKVCKEVSIVSVGINEVEFANSITMFPNPSSGKVTLNLNDDNIVSDIRVSVIDMLGRTVMPETKYAPGTARIELNLNSLVGGFYMVKIVAADRTAIKQLTLTGK